MDKESLNPIEAKMCSLAWSRGLQLPKGFVQKGNDFYRVGNIDETDRDYYLQLLNMTYQSGLTEELQVVRKGQSTIKRWVVLWGILSLIAMAIGLLSVLFSLC